MALGSANGTTVQVASSRVLVLSILLCHAEQMLCPGLAFLTIPRRLPSFQVFLLSDTEKLRFFLCSFSPG